MLMTDKQAFGTTEWSVCNNKSFIPITEYGVSIMVRRGNQRVSKKAIANAPAHCQSSAVAAPTPALPFGTLGGGSGSNPNVTLRQYGIEACPQCQTHFNSTNVRPVQEACGHIKCRTCFISNDDGCPQCNAERPRRGTSNTVASSSRRVQEGHDSKADDLDLMPTLLPVEEPLAGGFISSDKGRMAMGQLKESPPVLSPSRQKPPLKRKQSKEFSPSAPSKVQKASPTARSQTKSYKDSDARERPKGRRSSTNSSRNETRSASPKTSKFGRQGAQDRSNKTSNDVSGDSSGSMKRSSRIEMRKSTSTMQLNQQNAPATVASQILSQRKDKRARLSSLRSSTGSSSATSTAGRWSQPSSSPSASSRRKESAQPQILTKPKIGFPRQENKEEKAATFEMTISPTTIKPLKNAAIPPPSANIPVHNTVNPPLRRTEEVSIHFNAVTATRPDNVLPGCSSNDGSNSNSLETCDPLFIRNEWPDSNSAEGQASKPEPKKKKKRSPVTIHDHITILSGEPPLYQCNVCMKKFKTKAHIKYHEFCQNGEKPYKCEQCGQGFIAKSHYEYHLRTHTGERPYVCPKCGKGFNQRGKVTRHMRSHTGEKPFICQQCGRGFANAQALRSHFLIHTGERPFACQYCNKRFTGMTNLKKHVITHTGERPFSCTHCGKSFGLKWTLDLHLRTHSTERPFACDQCTRAFSNSKDLRRHLVIHSGERPFKCWICGTAFRRKDNLDRHIKNTHNQPKEVAKQLANEAAAEYLAQTKNNQSNQLTKGPSPKKTTGPLYSPSNRKATSVDPVPGTSRGPSVPKTDKKSSGNNTSDNMGVIITADLSPPGSPVPVGADIGHGDVYILPNGQSDIQQGNLIQEVGAAVVDAEVDPHGINVEVFDGLAELRTVPVSEYHQIEGIKLLEKAKTTGEPPESDEGHVMHTGGAESAISMDGEHDEKPIVDANSDLIFCGTPSASSSNQNFNHGLTVTVVYENDGKTHFITDQPASYSSGVNPLNFPSDQPGVLAIPRDTLFSFGPNDPASVEEQNPSTDETGSPPRSQDIQKKKSETILTGNLSKFLQMDLSKSAYTHNEGSGDSHSGSENLMESQREEHVESLSQALSGEGSSAFSNRSGSPISSTDENVLQQSSEISRNIAIIKEESLEEGEISQSPTLHSKSPFQDQTVLTLYKEIISDDSAVVAAGEKKSQRVAVDNEDESRDSVFTSRSQNELVASNSENNKIGAALIIKREIEDVDYGKEKLCDDMPSSSKSINPEENSVQARNKPTSNDSALKECNDTTLQDRLDYPSDPMFQDHIADDEDKLQRSDDNELPHDVVDKESVDSILPDGIDHYESPETMFQDKIVNSGHKLEDNAQSTVLLQDIVDKECPASILQDDNSNCGSVDSISDEEEGEFNEPVTENKQHEAQNKQNIFVDKNEMETETAPTDDESDFVPISHRLGQEIRFDVFKNNIHSHDNDTESISSTELEPMPEDRKVFEREFEGIVDEECPLSILEGDEDVSSDEGEIKPRRSKESDNKEPKGWSLEEKLLPSVKPSCFADESIVPLKTFSESVNSHTEAVSSSKLHLSPSQCEDMIQSPAETPTEDTNMASQIASSEGSYVVAGESQPSDQTVYNNAQSLVKNESTTFSDVDVEKGASSIIRTEQGPGEATDIEPISDTELEDLNENEIETSSSKESKHENMESEIVDLAATVPTMETISKLKSSEDSDDTLLNVKTNIAEQEEKSSPVPLFMPEEESARDSILQRSYSNEHSLESELSVEQDKQNVDQIEKDENVFIRCSPELVESISESSNTVATGNDNERNSNRESPVTEIKDTELNNSEHDTSITREDVTSDVHDEKIGSEKHDGIPYEVEYESDGQVVETAEKSTQCVNTEDFTDFNFNDDDSISEFDGQTSSEVLKEEDSKDTLVTNFKMSPTLEDTSEDQNMADANIPDEILESNVKTPESTQVESSMMKSESSERLYSVSPVVKVESHNEMMLENIGDSESEVDNSERMDFEGKSESDHQISEQPTASTSSIMSGSSYVKQELDYIAVPSSSSILRTPSQARLVYTNSTTTSGSLASQPSGYLQSNAVSYANFVTPVQTESSDSNYSFIYAPDVPTTVSSYPSKQSSFRFVYDNGEPVTETDPLDNNMRIVYACAAATADPPGDSSGPQKLKLLYAEALGVGTPDDSGQVQLVYTSTTPNQNIVRGPNQNVQIYSPTLIAADSTTSAENIQMLFAQQPQLEQNSSPVPVEVLYNGNGTVMAQTIGQPQDLSWIKRDLSHTFVTDPHPQHDKNHVTYNSNTRANSANPASTREITNHHNYASNPYLSFDSSKRIRLPGPYEGESDGLRTLARAAATRMLSIQADADATTRAAAAIAAVGREAQMKRQMDIIERSRNLPGSAVFVRKGENVPHRGPRKRYLSQLTNSRK